MSFSRLVARSLTHFWRTNLAVILGVATAIAVLAGALLVGHSVRGSLADLVQRRLGATDAILASPMFVREGLAEDLVADPRFSQLFRGAVPIIVADGIVTEQESGRRAGGVKVYGVDERFWRFHGVNPVQIKDREAAVGSTVARELDSRVDTAILIRVQRPSDVPLESLHGRKDDVGRTLRVTVRAVLDTSQLGEFSLEAQQGDAKAVFVPLDRLQEELEVGPRVNTILLTGRTDQPPSDAPAIAAAILDDAIAPEDVGFSVKISQDGHDIIIGSVAGLLDDRQIAAVNRISREKRLGASTIGSREVLSYLANAMRIGDREVPYSLVTGLDLAIVAPQAALDWRDQNGQRTPIVLNDWAARDLSAKPGDVLSMDYYIWEDPGRLVTRSADFEVTAIVPTETGGRDLAPDYPGISNASNLRDWDPPFPLDLRRVRPVDENYWERYRTTPKAFVPIEVAKRLWASRYGAATSVRVAVPEPQAAAVVAPQISAALKSAIVPAAHGLVITNVREQNLAASAGATDFGEYFVYFSFFLVASALILVVLFFKLGVEQRIREVGLLRAVGVSPASIRRLFATEGLLLATIGSVLGAIGAVAYAAALIHALTTTWVDAVGTTDLTLHVSVPLLLAGAAGGIVAAVGCIWWTLRTLTHVSERSLLSGDLSSATSQTPGSRSTLAVAWTLAVFGVVLAALGGTGAIPAVAGFFSAGAALLVAALSFAAVSLRRPARRQIDGLGVWPMGRLATRQVAYRPGRSVLTMAVLACATFILVTVDAFRRDGRIDTNDQAGGTGGYELMVRTLLPLAHDPSSEAGREALSLFSLDDATTIAPFRVRPGDDASCLNLYQPTNPRIAAPADEFLRQGRFAFASSVAAPPPSEDETRNPWLLLHRRELDGAIPVIADANSMTYVLHRSVGDTFEVTNNGRPVTLRFVASLRDSIFQSEVLMSSANFQRLFPEQPGYQMLLVDTPGNVQEVMNDLEQGLGDAEGDAFDTGQYLASFHRVENTYLSTFQTLGGLGLLLGTIGLATVLLRNVLERRKELGLLAAVGYRRSHFIAMAAAENLLIVLGGLGVGALCAAIAIAPAIAERGGRLPLSSGALLLLGAVFVVAMLSSIAAMAAATRSPLLESLRSE